MIHLDNKSKINWRDIKIGILGGGVSGIAAAKLGKYIGANIFISDNKYMETQQIDLSPLIYVVIMITIFMIAI